MGERKNKAMRAATSLMMGVLLSTSVLSGTMAKYIDYAQTTDQAKAAKFGITTAVNGSLFGESYASVDAGNSIQVYSVNNPTVAWDGTATSTLRGIVAPGTKNETGVTLKVSGSSEVSTKLLFSPNITKDGQISQSDIFLNPGSYGAFKKLSPNEAVQLFDVITGDTNDTSLFKRVDDATNGSRLERVNGATDSYDPSATYYRNNNTWSLPSATITSRYYPITYTVTGTKWDGTTGQIYQGNSILELEKLISTDLNGSTGRTKDPNQSYNVEYNVTWEWPFTNTSDTAGSMLGQTVYAPTDMLDTYLGVLMSDPTAVGDTIIGVETSTSGTFNVLKAQGVRSVTGDLNAPSSRTKFVVYGGTNTAPSFVYSDLDGSAADGTENKGTTFTNVYGCLTAYCPFNAYVSQVD